MRRILSKEGEFVSVVRDSAASDASASNAAHSVDEVVSAEVGDDFALGLVTRRAKAEEVCAILAEEYADAHCELDFRNAYELLVATVLSAQTTDQRVNTITPELFERWPSPELMAEASLEDLETVVRPLGMFRRRAAALQKLSHQLLVENDGEVPSTREHLVKLSGVGRKTANVVLGNWFGEDEITVDTHVARVTRRLGWVDASSPLMIERQLWELLPDAPWTMLCHQLIFHGRRVCFARNPACRVCPVAVLCPSADLGDQPSQGGQ